MKPKHFATAALLFAASFAIVSCAQPLPTASDPDLPVTWMSIPVTLLQLAPAFMAL